MRIVLRKDNGIHLSAEAPDEHIQSISVIHDPEATQVAIWVEISEARPEAIRQLVQYLGPEEAMALAQALEAAAAKAFKITSFQKGRTTDR